MSKIERVLGVLEGRGGVETPASFWYHFPPEAAHGNAAVAAHAQYFRETNLDFVKIMIENHHPGTEKIVSASDWARYRALDINSPQLQDQLDIIKRLVDTFGNEAYIAATIYGAVSSIAIASGTPYEVRPTALRDHYRDNPQVVSDALRATADGLAKFAKKAAEAGAHAVYYAAFGGEKDNFTDDEFAELVAPIDRLVLDSARAAGATPFLHVCRNGINLKRFVDYPVDVVNWNTHGEDPSLAEGAALFPGKTIMGGIDSTAAVLLKGSEAEVAAFAQATLDEAEAIPRFILGGDCSLNDATPNANIRAIADLAHATQRPAV